MKNKSRHYNSKTARFFTLNQDGTRGVSIDANGNRETIPFSMDGGKTIKNKSVLYHEQCGNFSFPVVRIKGKAVGAYPDSEVETKFYSTFDKKYPTELEANFAPVHPAGK